MYRLIKTQREQHRYLPEPEIWRYAHELSSAISYLHHQNILHRDIKPMNVLLTKDLHVKLADLGASRATRDSAFHVTRVGTPLYLAPELVTQTPYDFKVDIWALGCVLYHLAALRPPFSGCSFASLGYSILHTEPRSLPRCYSPRLSLFIKSMLEKRPSARPSITEIMQLIPAPKESDADELMTVTTDVTIGRGRNNIQRSMDGLIPSVNIGRSQGNYGNSPYLSHDRSHSPYPPKSPSPDCCGVMYIRPRTSSNFRTPEKYRQKPGNRQRQTSVDARTESRMSQRPESALGLVVGSSPVRLMSLIQPTIMLPLCSKPHTPLRHPKKPSVSALHD